MITGGEDHSNYFRRDDRFQSTRVVYTVPGGENITEIAQNNAELLDE